MKALHMKGVVEQGHGLWSRAPHHRVYGAGSSPVPRASGRPDDADEIVKRGRPGARGLPTRSRRRWTSPLTGAARSSTRPRCSSTRTTSHGRSWSLVAPPRDAGCQLLRVSENTRVRIPGQPPRDLESRPSSGCSGGRRTPTSAGTNYASDYCRELLGEEEVTSA